MARISELHYSNAYARSSGVNEFLEVSLSPGEDPANFTVSFYQANGQVGEEISLDHPSVQVSTGSLGETVYVISADDFNILLTDPDGGGSSNYEAYALTNTDTGDVIDFYDIGGGTTEITAVDGVAAGATSENVAVVVGPNQTTTTLQWNNPDPDTLTYGTVDPGNNGIACFVAGSVIETPSGLRKVQSLVPGDMVYTKDHGQQPVRWVGKRKVAGKGKFAPVRIAKGQFGAHRTHLVSQQHRVLVSDAYIKDTVGEDEVLVPAKALTGCDRVSIVERDNVTYVHILFDQHEIVKVNGVESESFFPGSQGISALDRASRKEIFDLFPDLKDETRKTWDHARLVMKVREAQKMARHL